MAQQVITVLTDDLDGTELKDGETITFGMDGVTYEIDLSKKNAQEMRKAIAKYVEAGRKKPLSESSVQKKRAQKNRDYDPKEVRSWAQAAKVQVPDRGRIPASVVEQFKKASFEPVGKASVTPVGKASVQPIKKATDK